MPSSDPCDLSEPYDLDPPRSYRSETRLCGMSFYVLYLLTFAVHFLLGQCLLDFRLHHSYKASPYIIVKVRLADFLPF